VSQILAADDVVFSDPRSIGNLVYLRDRKLAPSSRNSRAWDDLSLADLPEGSYVLINAEKLGLLTSAYKYVPPAFATSPPDRWEKVPSTSGSHLYRVRR